MNDEIKKALDSKFEQMQKELKEAQDSGATKVELEKLIQSLKTQGEVLEQIKSDMKEKQIETFGIQFGNFLAKNTDKLKELKNSKSGSIEFIEKAVGDMSTSSGGDGSETPPANMNTTLGSFNLRNDNDLLGLMNVSSTGSASLPYSQLEPKDGDYTFVAEGGTKPQIDFKWQNYYATPKKAAAYEVLSEEVVDDIARMVSVAKEFLRKKHDLFKVNGLYFGDGTGENPKGATVYGRVFSAGDMALKVATPSFMDVVNASITDIYTTQNYTDESPYMANVVLVNPNDFFLELVAAKDTNGLPMYPQAGLFNAVSIGGVTIRPWAKIPSGKIFVADMKMYNVANYISYSVRIGWINDQLITNQFTMVGESRFYGFVKKLDEQAFIYDDIATIKAAITKP